MSDELERIEWIAGDLKERHCPVLSEYDGKLRTCKRRDCPRCGPVWARDWRRSMETNLRALGRPVVLLSITAPGAERLPWDAEHCKIHPKTGRPRRAGHKHRGPDGCRVQQRAAREWADTCTYRWQKLRQAAALATERALRAKLGREGLVPRIVERVWEPQKRGVPHLHLVLPYGTPDEIEVAHCFAAMLAERARAYDFGFVDAKQDAAASWGRRLKPIGAGEAARYLASYLTGRNAKAKSSIRENIANPVMPRGLIWLTPKITSQAEAITVSGRPTHVTMRFLRRARHLFAAARGIVQQPQWQSWTEIAIVASVCRRAYRRGGGDEDELDMFALARDLDARYARARRQTTTRLDVFNTELREAMEQLAVSWAGLNDVAAAA